MGEKELFREMGDLSSDAAGVRGTPAGKSVSVPIAGVSQSDGAPEVREPFLGMAEALLERGARLGRFRPSHEVSAEMRGAPAVMHVLADAQGTLAPGEIAEATGVTDARVANILRALEERGWITRRRAEGDRRRVEVALTAEGREAHDWRARAVTRACAHFLEELGEEDSRDLIRVLGRMAELLEARGECGAGIRAGWAHEEEGR